MTREDAPDPLDPETLVDRYGEAIFRLARRLVGNDTDAEDVTQNVLLKVLRKASTFRGESDPMGWIYRITVNESREVFRRRGRQRASSLEDLAQVPEAGSGPRGGGSEPSPERRAAAAEVEARVQEAILDLPEAFREAVILLDLEGLSYKDAAEVLGLSLGGFKARVHRARLVLRERLGGLLRERPAQRPAGASGGRGNA